MLAMLSAFEDEHLKKNLTADSATFNLTDDILLCTCNTHTYTPCRGKSLQLYEKPGLLKLSDFSYRQYKISETDFGNFLRVKTNTKSIYFGSVILPRVFTLIATGKISKFKSIAADVNPENEFNIKNFEDTIEVQER